MKRSLTLLVVAIFAAGIVSAQDKDRVDTQPTKTPVPAPTPTAPASTGGKIACAKPAYDFGEVSQGDEVKHDYEVENVGKGELEIVNVHGSCGCTHAAAEKTKLAPGEKTIVSGTMNSAGKSGQTQITITVTTNDASNPNFNLTLTGKVALPFRPTVAEVNFGTLRKGTPIKDQQFEILSSSAQSITDIKTDNDQVKATFEPIPAGEKSQGFRVNVHVDGTLPVGQLRSLVSINTTVPSQKTITIPVLAIVEGEISVKPRTFNFGKVKKGDPITKTVEIEKVGKNDLKIENVQVKPDGAFTAKLEEVEAGKTYKIVLGLAPEAKDGYSRGTVSIKTNCPGETDLQVYFYALLNSN